MDIHQLIDALNLGGFAEAFVNPDNLPGHISYVLLITSMMMRTMHWLRFFAVAAGTFSAIYYFGLGDSVSFFWESTFTLVNVVQLLILFIENRRGRFSTDEQFFIEKVLRDVERGHVRRLMRLGAWTEVGEDFGLIQQDTEPQQLIYIVKGQARVERDGRLVGTAGPGDFLGEMSYLSGKPASATVVSSSPMRYLSFDRAALRRHLARNPEIRLAVEAGFNRNLVEKLVKTSHDLHASGAMAALSAAEPDNGDIDEAQDAARSAEINEELARLTDGGGKA